MPTRSKPAAAAKDVAAALKKIPKTDKQADKLKALAAASGAAFKQAAEEADALAAAVAKKQFKAAAVLLDAGVNPDARPDDARNAHDVPCALVGATRERQHALIDRLLAAGASVDLLFPDRRFIDEAWIAGCISSVELAAALGDLALVKQLVPLVRDPLVLPSATAALLRLNVDRMHLYRLPDPELDAAKLRQVLAVGLPAQGTSRCGLLVAHAAALAAKPELLDVLLEADPGLATRTLPGPRTLTLPVGNDQLTLGAGATPAGVATALLDACKRVVADDPSRKSELAPWITGLTANVARLVAAGGKVDAGRIELGAELQPLYEALCAWEGKAAVDEQLARIAVHTTPYLFMLRLTARLPKLVKKLAPLGKTNVLAFVLNPKNDRPVEHINEFDSAAAEMIWIDPERYAEAGRDVLDSGRILTLRGHAVLSTDEMNGGNLWEIDEERAVNHGSVGALVAALRQKLG